MTGAFKVLPGGIYVPGVERIGAAKIASEKSFALAAPANAPSNTEASSKWRSMNLSRNATAQCRRKRGNIGKVILVP